MREEIIQKILEKKIISIIRGLTPEQALRAAYALEKGGVSLIEVTFNQKDPASFAGTAEAIRTIRRELSGRALVGAGTVTSPELVELAAEAGAAYIISPDTDEDVIRKTREMGMVSIPGAYTATEAKRAWKTGADFVKIFPCIDNAPAYIKALCGPLNHIRFLAVGGVSADNAADFLKAGAVGVGVGGCLVKKSWAEAGEYEKITEEARRFVKNLTL